MNHGANLDFPNFDKLGHESKTLVVRFTKGVASCFEMSEQQFPFAIVAKSNTPFDVSSRVLLSAEGKRTD